MIKPTCELDEGRVREYVCVGIFAARTKTGTSHFKLSRFQKEYRGNKELAYSKTSQIVTLFVLSIIVLVSPFSLQAEITNVPGGQSTLLDQKHPSPKFGILASLSRSRSLIDHQDGTLQESLDITLNPTATWGKNSFSVKSAFSRDLRDSEKSDWTDTTLTFAREYTRWSGGKGLGERTFSVSLLGSLPTSKISSVKQSLMGSLGVGSSLSLLPQNAEYGFTLALGLTASKYFHRYDTGGDGSVNNSFGSNQSLLANIQMGKFSIGGEFVHKVRWTYQNSNKSAFAHSEELGYLISPQIQLALGHSNEGTAQKLSGDNNIQLIDENQSLIYSSLNMSY